MVDTEPFTMVGSEEPHIFGLAGEYANMTSAKIADIDIQITDSIRRSFPNYALSVVPASNVDLVMFANMGGAQIELDTENETCYRWRAYVPPYRRGGEGQVGDSKFFARYRYSWSGQEFILFTVGAGPYTIQYVLCSPAAGETPQSNSKITDSLILAAGKALSGDEDQYIYVFDEYWRRSRELWEQVQKMSWDDVIMKKEDKEELQEVAENFFGSKSVYDEYGIPWRRGLIFYGPVGNGKTISTKALMKTLLTRKAPKKPIPTLSIVNVADRYVKSAPYLWMIREVFEMARMMAPCLLVMEDIETIVTNESRSYFFNEVDGLEDNNGIMMIASTNYLDRLDPGISKRPSRFDRKYLFPLPGDKERELYAEFWRKKLSSKSSIKFPQKLTVAMSKITKGFSFAFLQEAFVATMLVIAHDKTGSQGAGKGNELHTAASAQIDERYVVNWIQNDDVFDGIRKEKGGDDGDEDDLNKYMLWRVFKQQVKILRRDLESENLSPRLSNSTQTNVTPELEEPQRSMLMQQQAQQKARQLAMRQQQMTPQQIQLLQQRAQQQKERSQDMAFQYQQQHEAESLHDYQARPILQEQSLRQQQQQQQQQQHQHQHQQARLQLMRAQVSQPLPLPSGANQGQPHFYSPADATVAPLSSLYPLSRQQEQAVTALSRQMRPPSSNLPDMRHRSDMVADRNTADYRDGEASQAQVESEGVFKYPYVAKSAMEWKKF